MTVQPTRILPATAEHLPAISELAGVIWRACYPGIIPAEQIDYMLEQMYAPETMREEICSRGICYERLLAGDELVGFASYGPADQSTVFGGVFASSAGTPHQGIPAAERAVPDFKLHKLYLLPELHGRGLGSLLLQHVEREVRQLGARRLVLSVNKDNVKAIASYQRNGFAVAESVVTAIGGGFVMDDFVMAKELK